MKLAIIYNVWDGIELLKYSMRSMQSETDVFIIVFQNISNFGEHYAPIGDMELDEFRDKYIFKLYTPDTSLGGGINETNKRNLGIRAAREIGCTHFLLADCDEIYADFPKAISEYEQCGTEGSVCRILTYFKSPTLRFKDFDNYFVPFIHKMRPDSTAGHAPYPFYVDPTRRINCAGVTLIDEPMHHFSYIRRNIQRKIRNSTAKHNIERSQLLQDYNDPLCGPGFFVKDFNQELIEVENTFGIVAGAIFTPATR